MEQKLKVPLKEAVKFLEENEYQYAIIGGIALSQLGVVRVTRDVDFKILVPDSDYENVKEKIKAVFPKPARQNLPENPLIVSVLIKGVIVYFLLAIPGFEEQIITRAIRKGLGGIKAWVCSAEDLIIQKAVAGRGRDWPDIEALLIEQRKKWMTFTSRIGSLSLQKF